MSSNYAFDPAFADMPNMNFPRNRLLLRLANIMVWGTRFRYKWGDDIQTTNHFITGMDGNKIKVIEVARKDLDDDAPAIVYFHGGAFFLTYAGIHLDSAQIYARETGSRVFVVDYRLSTSAAFPAALHDSQSALEWVHDNAQQLKVDKSRIIVSGDSAGGGLAASCAQMTQDRNRDREDKINILAQFLIYPVCDCETKTETAVNFTDTPVWNTANNKVMWEVLLRDSDYGKGVPGAAIPQYASPVHRENLAGLPPAYIEPTEFDPLRDEAFDYGAALEKAGVPVTMVEAKAAVHGYEFVDCDVTTKYRKLRVDAMNEYLAK